MTQLTTRPLPARLQPGLYRRRALTADIAAVVTSCVALLRSAADTVVGGTLNVNPADHRSAPAPAALASTPEPLGNPPEPMPTPPEPRAGAVVALVYELLDAHDDTAQMASELEPDPLWQAHLDYLRALQRKGRETLAHLNPDQAA